MPGDELVVHGLVRANSLPEDEGQVLKGRRAEVLRRHYRGSFGIGVVGQGRRVQTIGQSVLALSGQEGGCQRALDVGAGVAHGVPYAIRMLLREGVQVLFHVMEIRKAHEIITNA